MSLVLLLGTLRSSLCVQHNRISSPSTGRRFDLLEPARGSHLTSDNGIRTPKGARSQGTQRGTVLLPVAITLAALVMLGAAFRDYLIDTINVFGVLFLEGLFALVAFGVVLAAVGVAVLAHGRRRRHAILVPFILVLAVGAVFTLPFEWAGRRIDLVLGDSQRMEIVRLVASGELGGSEALTEVDLPFRYQGLSSDGTIGIQRTATGFTVMFVRSRGVVDAWAGIAYSNTGGPGEDDPRGSVILRVEPFGGDWYWIWAH